MKMLIPLALLFAAAMPVSAAETPTPKRSKSLIKAEIETYADVIVDFEVIIGRLKEARRAAIAALEIETHKDARDDYNTTIAAANKLIKAKEDQIVRMVQAIRDDEKEIKE